MEARTRKENQIYSLEEMYVLNKLTQDERKRKEKRVLAQFKATGTLSDPFGTSRYPHLTGDGSYTIEDFDPLRGSDRLILADAYGASIERPAAEGSMNAARRKALTLRFARLAAERIARLDGTAPGI